MHIICLLALSCLSFSLAKEGGRDTVQSTAASVLPYVLKRLNLEEVDSKASEKTKKRYTLLAAASLSPSLSPPPSLNAINKNVTEDELPDGVALAKTDYEHKWGYGPHFVHGHHNHHGNAFDFWNDVYKYYYTKIGVGNNAWSSHGAPVVEANLPSTLLVFLNLGFILYILLSIVGLLGRLLNFSGDLVGFKTGAYPAANHPHHASFGPFGSQYDYWRNAAAAENFLEKKYSQTIE